MLLIDHMRNRLVRDHLITERLTYNRFLYSKKPRFNGQMSISDAQAYRAARGRTLGAEEIARQSAFNRACERRVDVFARLEEKERLCRREPSERNRAAYDAQLDIAFDVDVEYMALFFLADCDREEAFEYALDAAQEWRRERGERLAESLGG